MSGFATRSVPWSRGPLLLLAPLIAALPVAADTPRLATPEVPRLERIEPGGVLLLSDGLRVRLAFLRLPDLMTDMPANGRADPDQIEGWRVRAEGAIRAALVGPDLRFEPIAVGPDRHGALPVLVRTGAQTLLQEQLLAAGMARLDLAALADPRAEALVRAESAAREEGRGLWSAWPYRLRDDTGAGNWLGTFQLVQGRIHRAAQVGGNVFVNFGADYQSDFTVLFKGTAARTFRKGAPELGRLAGCRVLVRGWIEYWNGPLVAATDPGQLEFLEPCA